MTFLISAGETIVVKVTNVVAYGHEYIIWSD